MPGARPEQLVALGVVARPHGVRGELRVHPYNPASTLLREVPEVHLRAPGGAVTRALVEHVRSGPKGGVLLTLRDVEGREAAEGLKGTEVCVPRAALPPAADGEWYLVDLVGLRACDEAGETLGEVVGVERYPTIDCLIVRAPDGDREVPLAEPFVGDVDLGRRQVVVRGLAEVPLVPPRRRRGG